MKSTQGLALYRTLEFPNETARSWPIARSRDLPETIVLRPKDRQAAERAATKSEAA